MNSNLIQKVLLKGYPGFRLGLLCFFWSILVAGLVFFGVLLASLYLFPKTSEALIIEKKISVLSLFSASSSFSAEELSQIRSWPEVKRADAIQTAKIPVFLQLDLNGTSWGSSLFLESVPDDWLDSPVTWPQDKAYLPIIIGNEFVDLYNWGFAPSQGLPKLTLGEASLIPLKLTVGSSNKAQAYPAKIWAASERYQTFLIPRKSMEEIFGPSATITSRLICEAKTGQYADFKKHLEAVGWELSSKNSGPWRILSENLLLGAFLVLALFIILVSGWMILFLKLWWSRLAERIVSLFELSCDIVTLYRNMAIPFLRTLILSSLGGILLLLGVWALFLMGSEQSGVLLGLLFIFDLSFALGFGLVYVKSLRKTLRDLLASMA